MNNHYRTTDIELSKTRLGIAKADSPEGPWEKLATNPILIPSEDANYFDSHRMDDASLIIRNGKYWLYYKGRKWGERANQTKMGVAIADNPEGPYVKYENNPVIAGGHEVLVWPQGSGVATIIGKVGPATINRSIMYAEDGLNFIKTHSFSAGPVPVGPGAYRPDAYTDNGNGQMIKWGLHRNMTAPQHIERYDLATDSLILNTP